MTKTKRGFNIAEFTDRYGEKCSLQKSSLAFEDCIWLGINHAEPKIMASQAHYFDIATNKTAGWIPYPVPEEVLINTRMHLTREQVKGLLPYLERFAETGYLE